jgi:hypothetical protein
MKPENPSKPSVPWFGARKYAERLLRELEKANKERTALQYQLDRLGAFSVIELEQKKLGLLQETHECAARLKKGRETAEQERKDLLRALAEIRGNIVDTEETAALQEAGVYRYRHPLTDAVAYQLRLQSIESQIKEMAKKDGGAIESATAWHVNGSEAQGRAMVRDISKLMLRAFNAEADNLVRGLKPHRLAPAVERLNKVALTIEKLGKLMQIRIANLYRLLRIQELELTADFIQKQAEEKETERLERERLREERKVQQEIERERQRLEKERNHYVNAMRTLVEKDDIEGVQRLQGELAEIDKAIKDVDYRAANIRAGYVYVISNIGSFGESVVKIGMTRRLDPMDRIRELSDASVPFNFDIHALFFSKDAVGIETALHSTFAKNRVNIVNLRREFFRVPVQEVKSHLAHLAGELLEFHEIPEALEYRQCLTAATSEASPSPAPLSAVAG